MDTEVIFFWIKNKKEICEKCVENKREGWKIDEKNLYFSISDILRPIVNQNWFFKNWFKSFKIDFRIEKIWRLYLKFLQARYFLWSFYAVDFLFHIKVENSFKKTSYFGL